MNRETLHFSPIYKSIQCLLASGDTMSGQQIFSYSHHCNNFEIFYEPGLRYILSIN